MSDLLTLFNLLITLCFVIGTIVAYKNGLAKATEEIQTRVIAALQSEIQSLKDRLETLEKENTRLNHVLTTIRMALKRRGLVITIDGELVSIHDQSGGTTTHFAGISNPSTDKEDV
jgi:cell division protein FtsB